MPVHAQVICIGGNALAAFFFVIGGFTTLSSGDTGLGVFLLLMAAALLYSLWVLLKFRRYLGAEQALEREAHIEELRRQLDAVRTSPGLPADQEADRQAGP